ncbi:MAG: hypothetical protein ACPGVB_01730 [Chitinophagales bacterium]
MLKCIWWKILFFVLLICHGFTASALSVDAGEDRKICKNGFAVLGGSPTVTDGQAPYTFSWRADTGGNFSNESNPSVFPNQTTIYTVVVVDANGISCVASVTLTTVEVRLTVEADLTSCMEDRELTFFAIAEGLDIADGPITYEFWHQEQPNSNNAVEYTFFTQKKVDESGGEVLFTIKANPDAFACKTELDPVFWNHAYTAGDYVIATQGDFICISDVLNFDVHELSIALFADNASGKHEKVVVGKNIDYSAFASDDCKHWTWRMPDGPNGFVIDTCAEHPTLVANAAWRPTGGNARSNTGLSSLDSGTPMVIPFSDLTVSGTSNLRVHNNWFGGTYGLVEAYCLDAEDHFYHDFHRVEVFFDPDLDVLGQATKNNPYGNEVTNLNEPCWFIFWKEGNVIEGIEDFEYNENATYIGAYGWNDADSTGNLYLTPRSDDQMIYNHTLMWDITSITLTSNLRHINLVAATIAHEIHHQDIQVTWNWNPNTTYVHSDFDKLPNAEETLPNILGFPSQTYFIHSDHST